MKIPGPACGYVDLLDQATRKEMEAGNPQGRKYHPFRPSSAGKCTRELALELMEFLGKAKYDTKVDEPESHRLLALGNYIENHLLRQFEKLGPEITMKYKQQVLEFYYLEAKNHPEFSHLVEGSLDTCFWSEKHRAVVDFKSKKDKWSSFYSSNWEQTSANLASMKSVVRMSETTFWVEDLESFVDNLNDAFFAGNFLQLNGYACTQFLKDRGIDHAALIQYNKNTSELREIRFKPSDAVHERVRLKFQKALDAVDADNLEIAPKDFILGSMKCAFCKFSKECYGNADSLKAWFKTAFPPKKWPTDIYKINDPDLKTLFDNYEQGTKVTSDTAIVEQEILLRLTDQKVEKVRLENGNIYEVRMLKSPRPHLEIRRSKA